MGICRELFWVLSYCWRLPTAKLSGWVLTGRGDSVPLNGPSLLASSMVYFWPPGLGIRIQSSKSAGTSGSRPHPGHWWAALCTQCLHDLATCPSGLLASSPLTIDSFSGLWGTFGCSQAGSINVWEVVALLSICLSSSAMCCSPALLISQDAAFHHGAHNYPYRTIKILFQNPLKIIQRSRSEAKGEVCWVLRGMSSTEPNSSLLQLLFPAH